MPNCFQLFAKTNPTRPAILQDVDDAMRQHFGAPPDPHHYFAGWYTVIGSLIAIKGLSLGSKALRLAIVDWYKKPCGGNSPADMRVYMRDMLLICRWLETHYTSSSFVTIGRRD
jgi:hypothetical protein